MSLFLIFTCISLYTLGELCGICRCSLYLYVSLYIALGDYVGGVVVHYIYMYHFIYPWGIIRVMLLFLVFICGTLYTLEDLGW